MVGSLALGNIDDATQQTKSTLPVGSPVIKLDAFTVEDAPPKLCFGVSLSLWKNGHTGLVTAIYINKVKHGSSAEEHGLGPRTRIYRINDQPVEEMVASFNGDTELNKLFINRKIGSKITVEAQPEGAFEAKTVTLVEKMNLNVEINIWD